MPAQKLIKVHATRRRRVWFLAIVVSAAAMISGLLAFGQEASVRFRAVDRSWQEFNVQASQIAKSLSELRGHVGDGGITRDFKHYVLWGDARYAEKIDRDIEKINRDAATLAGLLWTAEARDALDVIRATLDLYIVRFDEIRRRGAERSIVDIDRFAKIDGGRALKAWEFLLSETERQSRIQGEAAARDLQNAIAFLHKGAAAAGLIVLIAGIMVVFLRRELKAEEAALLAGENARELARTDALTGLNNRRAFFEYGKMIHDRARRYGRAYCAMMIDIDHFKKVNDVHGHAVGDAAIKAVADVIARVVRATDVSGRIGGEEFAVLLPEASLGEVQALAERLRASIAEISIPVQDGRLKLTASVGVNRMDDSGASIEKVMEKADAALYPRSPVRVIKWLVTCHVWPPYRQCFEHFWMYPSCCPRDDFHDERYFRSYFLEPVWNIVSRHS